MSSSCPHGNKVGQTVASGWDYKTVYLTCGSTGVDGMPLECWDCEKDRGKTKAPPPGYCRHGNRLYDDSDNDIFCLACEVGD